MRQRGRPLDLDEHLREPVAPAQSLEDAEDAAAGADWLARDARGETHYIPLSEVRQRLGLSG